MAFSQESNRIPTFIGFVKITLRDPDGTIGSKTIDGRVEILDQEGVVMRVWEGDLRPHLSNQTLQTLSNFLTNLRTQAENELLP